MRDLVQLAHIFLVCHASSHMNATLIADDKLVIAVGSTSNDHGVKGLENCFQLKTIPDAQAVRRRIMGKPYNPILALDRY